MINPEEDSERWDAEVHGKERLFVLRYCTDSATFLNATATYQKVYTKADENGKVIKLAKDVCEAAASRLMKRERVRLAIAKLLRATQADVDERAQYQLLHDMFLYATYNPAEIITSDGTLRKDLSKMGELAKCITGIYPTKYGLRIQLADRGKYIQQLMQYLDIIRPETDTGTELNVVEMVRKCVNVDEWNKFAEESEAGNEHS